MPRAELSTTFPSMTDADIEIGDIALFLTINDGALTTPDPDVLRSAGYGGLMEE